MVKARLKSCLPVLAPALVLALGALVLGAIAALRGAEYDEQYTLFLTSGVARPVWPETPFLAGDVQALQAGHGSLGGIAHDLRATDVHPPLYFWAVALWRRLAGDGLFEARLFSVLCGLAALAAVGAIARRVGAPPALAMLLTLGCYGFAYTGAIARGFALAQALTLWGVAMLLAAEGRRSRMLAAGLLLGAATFANYLAVFVAAGALVTYRRGRSVRLTPPPLVGGGWGEGAVGGS
ncbi:MAG TPA: glycosyltransferase family 39 protein, partial [Acetobacteraceae bacterium]